MDVFVTVIEKVIRVRNTGGDVRAISRPGRQTVRLTREGRQGPIGETGLQGPAGIDGTDDAYYQHIQSVPSATWTVVHGLGKRPSVTVLDSSDRQVIGNVTHVSVNQLTISFSAAFSGTAECN